MKKMMLTWLTVASLLMGCSGSETSVKGTYRNPVIYADVPDMSVTRAGEYYYMISTTMHLMPGGPVMRSKDLVNWETVSYVFDKLTDNSKYDLIGGTVYGRGQWASSIRYHNGKFYVLFSPNDVTLSVVYIHGGRSGREVCYRADKITGPYEKKVILEHDFDGYGGVGQGCIIDSEEGDWYGVIFQDRGGIGRVPTLMPCRWVDGWPMLGDENGHVPLTMEKEIYPTENTKGILGSDDFNGEKLSLYWQWNHNPVDDKWSLTERPGYLRLETSRVVDNLYLAPNTITQRMEGPKCKATVSLDISNMKDGDVAGFSAFNGHSGLLSVVKEGDAKRLVMSTSVVNFDNTPNKAIASVDVEEKEQVELNQNIIYLRIEGDFTPKRDIATFYYSLDNKEWKKIGTDFKMRFDYTKLFMGSKFAIFNYATKSLGGYVDVDYFDYERANDRVTINK